VVRVYAPAVVRPVKNATTTDGDIREVRLSAGHGIRHLHVCTRGECGFHDGQTRAGIDIGLRERVGTGEGRGVGLSHIERGRTANYGDLRVGDF